MIKAVVFDIGNVLVEWHPERLYDTIIGEDRRRALFNAVDLEGMNLSVDKGAPFRDTVFAKADEHPDWADEIRIWHDRWPEMFEPVIAHSVKLKSALQQKGIPVFSLSNFGVDTFEMAKKTYPFLADFDQQFISGHLEKIKPDPGIYKALEDGTGLTGESLIFVDDRPENIEAAKARGWHGHLFEGPAGWAERLVTEGLLTRDEAAA